MSLDDDRLIKDVLKEKYGSLKSSVTKEYNCLRKEFDDNKEKYIKNIKESITLENYVKYLGKATTLTLEVAILSLVTFELGRTAIATKIWKDANNYKGMNFIGQCVERYDDLRDSIDNLTKEDIKEWHYDRIEKFKKNKNSHFYKGN